MSRKNISFIEGLTTNDAEQMIVISLCKISTSSPSYLQNQILPPLSTPGSGSDSNFFRQHYNIYVQSTMRREDRKESYSMHNSRLAWLRARSVGVDIRHRDVAFIMDLCGKDGGVWTRLWIVHGKVVHACWACGAVVFDFVLGR